MLWLERGGPANLTYLRSKICAEPRKQSDEIDGIELAMDWMIEVYFIVQDKLGVL
jgi:hypothetical protein